MATTQLSDVFYRDVLASYLVEDSVTKTAFSESGILTASPIISQLAAGASNVINVPFWKPIDSSIEPNYNTDDPADVAVPRKVITGEQTARVAYVNEGFESADLVTELTKQNPLQYVAGRLDRFWMEQAQRRIIATTVGLYNDNVAGNAGDMVLNVSVATGTPAAANKFSAEAFIDAQATMGDTMDAFGGIAMHRLVYSSLQKQNLIEFIPASDGRTQIATYQGLRVIIDNGMPNFAGDAANNRQYLSVIFGAGAFGYGMFEPANNLAFERVEAAGNGGGIETLWTRKNMIIHPFGYKFNSATITGNGTEAAGGKSASWSDLALATNWTRVVDRKNVPLAFLVANA